MAPRIPMPGPRQSPVDYARPHALDPNQPKRNPQTLDDIINMMSQMPIEAVGGDGSYEDANATMDAMGEVAGRSPAGVNPMIEELMALIGNPPAGATGQGGGPPRQEDAAFAEAMEAWIAENGKEPATDGEFAEIEEWAAGAADDDRAYDKRNPR